MRPKIDVIEREWKNLKFEGNLNKALLDLNEPFLLNVPADFRSPACTTCL